MYGMYAMIGPGWWLLLLGIGLTMWAQAKVKMAYGKYSQIRIKTGITGEEAARRILSRNGMSQMNICRIEGSLTDNYNPTTKQLSLSSEVYKGDSIASVAIAAHEVGHAIQHHENYFLLNLRNVIAVPISIISNLGFGLIFIGFMVEMLANAGGLGTIAVNLGIIFFATSIVFHLVTLPVEINASSRALKQLVAQGIVSADEKNGAKKVLSAAALTYLAALAYSILEVVRLLLIRNR